MCKYIGEVYTETAFGGGRIVYSRRFRRLIWAYIYARIMAWIADHFVIPKHYGWQTVRGSRGNYEIYDRTPVPIGIYWRVIDETR